MLLISFASFVRILGMSTFVNVRREFRDNSRTFTQSFFANMRKRLSRTSSQMRKRKFSFRLFQPVSTLFALQEER
jgi:hypothetical protein